MITPNKSAGDVKSSLIEGEFLELHTGQVQVKELIKILKVMTLKLLWTV